MSSRNTAVPLALAATCLLAASGAGAATLEWSGYTWQVTSGGMAGVCEGDPANVSVDADGYLHLQLRKSGNSWTAAELFTTDKLGFGTYQWHIDGPIDTYDKNVVLGLFPYGPAAGIGDDGTNEIDIEYSRWGVANGPNGDFTDYPASGTTVGELSYSFSLDGSTLSTSRFIWTTSGITSSLHGGLVPVDSSDALIKSFTYEPPNSMQNIPQRALPLGMNLWCFDAPPSDEQPVAIVIRDFTFVPEGMAGAGSGGSGGQSGAGGRGSGGQSGTGGGGSSAGGPAGATTGGAGGRAGASTVPAGGAGGSNLGDSGQGGAGGANRAGTAGGGTAGAGAPAGSPGTAGEAGRTMPPAVAGSPSSSNASKPASGDAGGCGCSVPSSGAPTSSGVVTLLITALALRRRARRRFPLVARRASLG